MISQECIGSLVGYLVALNPLQRCSNRYILFFLVKIFSGDLLRDSSMHHFFWWFMNLLPMQHVTSEGLVLVKQAEDAASNKKVSCSVHLFIALSYWFIHLVAKTEVFIHFLERGKINYFRILNQRLSWPCKAMLCDSFNHVYMSFLQCFALGSSSKTCTKDSGHCFNSN